MANNKGLAKAKDNKKDEFYTVYATIQEELNHYESHFVTGCKGQGQKGSDVGNV